MAQEEPQSLLLQPQTPSSRASPRSSPTHYSTALTIHFLFPHTAVTHYTVKLQVRLRKLQFCAFAKFVPSLTLIV